MSRDLPDDLLEPTGILGVDFVNTEVTVGGTRIDLLASPDDFVHWMSRVGDEGLTELVPDSWPELRTLTVEARSLRDALRLLFSAVAEGETPSPGATFVVARALDRAAGRYAMVETRDPTGEDADRAGRHQDATGRTKAPAGLWRPEVRRRFLRGGATAPLTPIAHSAVEMLSSVDRRRLRPCAAPDCRRWFVDTSRGGRRRWCSMARCGNRRKAARYRERHADQA